MQHKAIKYGDEYQCSSCGKSWAVDDDDVPSCDTETFNNSKFTEMSMLKAQIVGLKTLIQINEHRMNIPSDVNLNWTPKQWYNHLNILKLRDTINTHE